MSAYGTLDENDGAPVLRFERRLNHPIEKVWRAISDPAEMKHWFPAEVTAEMRVGETMRFYFVDHEMQGPDGEIVEFDPPHVFAFLWGDELIRITLEPDGKGCHLVFTHAFKDRSGAAKFMAGWHVCLDALETALDDPSGLKSEHPEWDGFFKEYTERFGVVVN
jgi:uncharacterized protein YndB with AHSA1/START domain